MRLRAVLSILALATLSFALPAAAAELAPPAVCGTADAAASTVEELFLPAPTERIRLCLNPKPPGVDCSDFNTGFCSYGTWNCDTGCCDPFPGPYPCAPVCQAPT